MINQKTLYADLENANKSGPTVAMTSDEIQKKSQALQRDIEELEQVREAFDNGKISQKELIAHCVNGIDLLRRYQARVPSYKGGPALGPYDSTGQNHFFFRAEYYSRLKTLLMVLLYLIHHVKIDYVARGWHAESRVDTLRRYRGPCVEI